MLGKLGITNQRGKGAFIKDVKRGREVRHFVTTGPKALVVR